MQIDIISDTVCPWCFIGKRRLEQALAERPDLDVQINWHPFQLNPDMPDGGRDHKEYYREKFGDDARVRELVENMTAAGAVEGLEFDFEAIEKSPNTLASHRLIRWAATAGCQGEVVEALFRAYFIEGRDIGDHDILTEISESVGMEADIVKELYVEGRDVDLVNEDIAGAQQMGIRGVPFFIIDYKYGVSGAQSPAVFIDVFDKILAGDGESEDKDVAKAEKGIEAP